MCQHHSCQIFRRSNASGVACILLNHHVKNGKSIGWVSLLGLEKHGRFKGSYNLCAGGIEKKDQGCYLRALMRELAEEFKIRISDFDAFDAIFKGNKGLRYIVHGGTPVFIGVVNNVKSAKLNALIDRDNRDYNLPFAYKEMARVDWFRLDGKQRLKPPLPVSAFATAVMLKVDPNKL